jgi:hypothetical protein
MTDKSIINLMEEILEQDDMTDEKADNIDYSQEEE